MNWRSIHSHLRKANRPDGAKAPATASASARMQRCQFRSWDCREDRLRCGPGCGALSKSSYEYKHLVRWR